MSFRRVYKVVSDGFQQYFDGLVANMTEAQRQTWPKDIHFKVVREKDGTFSVSGKTNLEEKLAIIWKVFQKHKKAPRYRISWTLC